MKRFIVAFLLIALNAGVVFAAGGQSQGTAGSGTTSTGSTSQGSASQPRTGR